MTAVFSEARLERGMSYFRALAPAGRVPMDYNAAEVVRLIRNSTKRAGRLIPKQAGIADDPQHRAALAEQVRVVDRQQWARRNFIFVDALTEGKYPARSVAGVLAVLSTKVLGQYLPTFEGTQAHLLMVAPNIVATRQRMQVSLPHFALWVALHEQTHAAQFAHAPWLTHELYGTIRELLSGGLLASMTQAQESDFARINAIMSLLEGHADVMMDAVPRYVLPNIADLRKKFQSIRGARTNPLVAWVQQFMGMKEKQGQYTKGGNFVEQIIEARDQKFLNRVWERTENLPKPNEISDPHLWINRIDEEGQIDQDDQAGQPQQPDQNDS